MTKVYRHQGELIGLSGNVRDAIAWLRWYTDGKKDKKPRLDSFTGLVLRSDGLWCVTVDCFEMLIERGFHGVGSGGMIATGAFMAGAPAKKAVEIACEIDANSGGKVVVHRFKG